MSPVEPAFPPAEAGVTAASATARWRGSACCAVALGGCSPGYLEMVGPRRRPEPSGRVSEGWPRASLRPPAPRRLTAVGRRLRSLYFTLSAPPPNTVSFRLNESHCVLLSLFSFFLSSCGGHWRQHDHSKSLHPFSSVAAFAIASPSFSLPLCPMSASAPPPPPHPHPPRIKIKGQKKSLFCLGVWRQNQRRSVLHVGVSDGGFGCWRSGLSPCCWWRVAPVRATHERQTPPCTPGKVGSCNQRHLGPKTQEAVLQMGSFFKVVALGIICSVGRHEGDLSGGFVTSPWAGNTMWNHRMALYWLHTTRVACLWSVLCLLITVP